MYAYAGNALVKKKKMSKKESDTRAGEFYFCFSNCPGSFFCMDAMVCGAAGGIGQPLALLLKQDPNIDELSLYDVAPVVAGVAVDISHISTPCQVVGGYKKGELDAALRGADVVVVPAGVPRKPGMTRDDLFKINAGINADLATACAKNCPSAMFCVISNPVNSMVPIWKAVLAKHGCYDKRRLFGVTTLDVTRANTFVAEKLKVDVNSCDVPVIGGHAGTTILPLLSHVSGIPDAELDALTKRIQFGGDEVVKAKDGAGSATLSMAHAGAAFTAKVAAALKGPHTQKACAFVDSEIYSGCGFFASPVTLNTMGIAEIHTCTMSDREKQLLDAMLPDLKAQVRKGEEFGATHLATTN
ncbi:unnamed protein product [Amoebophrya sp. A120]|nr:unnamed protein product [Amoebophrya sp. A120]|eukprot:GSA120T00022798001.1